MSALSRADEGLRAVRRELEGGASEVPDHMADELRHLAASVQVLRVRLQALVVAMAGEDPDPPAAA